MHFHSDAAAPDTEKRQRYAQDTAAQLARAVNVVDAQFKSTADQAVHLWGLICLLRAAEASGTYLARHRRRGSGIRSSTESRVGSAGRETATVALCTAWRAVWGTLLRVDQRFSSATGRCEAGGIGEAVVAVLGACMRERLVEPAFVTKEQARP